MAKMLKPLVVIVLLLALVAVCIQAFVLFPKRTLIKERTQRLERGIGRVVNTLKGDQSLLDEETKGALRFSTANLQVAHVDNLPQLDAEISRADAVALAVLRGWNDTQEDLDRTREELEQTRAELERTRNQLEEARAQIVQLNDIIRAKDQELIEKDRQIASLEDEKSALEFQISDLNDRLGDLQDQMAELEEEKTMIEILLAKCEGERGDITMAPGTSGKIVYANPEWNFVVIDVGSAAGAQVTANMIVHRDDNMIGKIEITAVRENVSIADVLTDFQKESIKEGDHVLF